MSPHLAQPTTPKATMSPPRMSGRSLASALTAAGIALIVWTSAAPAASADPDYTQQDAGVVAAPPESAPLTDAGAGDAATAACQTFSAAENYAASGYEDFAYASAGNGNQVDYADPSVSGTNAAGRTALRQAAATAMQASSTPGLTPDTARPMEAWSLRVVKLLAIMGVHGGGNALNSAATDVNEQSQNVDAACAAARD